MKPARNVSPADIVRRELESHGGAERIGAFLTTHQKMVLDDILLRGKMISQYEANHLSGIFHETSPAFWLNLQAAYDSRDATEQHVTGSIGAIPQGIAASDSIEWDGERVTVKRRGAI